MPRLPERPDFNQLTKQAKDLLRAYEAGEAAALERLRQSLPSEKIGLKLHDAQSCIAREYGFSSWQQLRDYVDWLNSRFSRERQDAVPL